MAERILQSTTFRVPFIAYLATDGRTPATGKTIAITISKNCAAFGNPNAGATNATEIGSGWYYVELDTTDTATLGPLLVHGTNVDIDPVDVPPYTVAVNTVNTIAATATPLKKNTARAKFPFVMRNSSGVPTAGLTVTGTTVIDGAAEAALANAVVEVSHGQYYVDLAAADVNGDTISLRFAASGAIDTIVPMLMQP
jgi:hypothetical protein